jgi:hypothetical protein
LIRAEVPAGIARVVLEGCRRSDLRAWVPRAVARTDFREDIVLFEIPVDVGLEMFRVRADGSDPLPASFYSGTTNFPGTPAGGPGGLAGGPLRDTDAPPGNEGQGGDRAVVESDIWAIRENTLFFFNQLRGLQVIDISAAENPGVTGTFPLPGMGEQMYLLGDQHVVLLAHDPCSPGGTTAESAVIVVDTTASPPAERARVPLKGRIIESRLVGHALYVATETWQPVGDGSGAWQAGTWVSGLDLADPAMPIARQSLWLAGSGNVVTATDRFLFVAMTDYSRAWPWKSDLQVVDVSSPDATIAAYATIPLPGRVADKFKIDVFEDVLRVVIEAAETSAGQRWVTVLETYRLFDPRSVPPIPYAALDRLELARGERLFATRLDGVRGYIVTFERIDPLWVIDLSDPEDVRIAGELEIPGWSTYIRPMGARLLTLGVDDARGSRVAVQLFDVGDPASPKLLAKVPLGEHSSWSEANYDEKAFGVFPDAGLLLVPLTEWSEATTRQGVQLIDFGENTLAKRGFLASEDLVPRRATLHGDRVLAVSGRKLVTASIVDRDAPSPGATVELAYPVERVLVTSSHLLEFTGDAVRVRPLEGDASDGTIFELGDSTLLGAVIRGPLLHVLQGKAATVTWEQIPPEVGEWIARTNPGTVRASVWDASALPELRRVGEAAAPTHHPWLSDVQAHWLSDDLLVWADHGFGSWPWWWWRGPILESAAGRPAADTAVWIPWWSGGTREFTAITFAADGSPKIVSRVQPGSTAEGNAIGEVFAVGKLLYSSRERVESKIVGTNFVTETAWFESEPDVRDASKGEWRTVTNAYPIVQWWSHHELDVTDYSSDPAAPALRVPLPLPGALRGVSHSGAMIYTTADRPISEDQPQRAWLDASAYDGVSVHFVDALELADYGKSENYALTMRGAFACVARGGWNADATPVLEIWRIGERGEWQREQSAALSGTPGELRVFGDLLLARGGGVLDLFGLTAEAVLLPLDAVQPPGCFGGDLNRGDGDAARGLWLPLGEFGTVRVGP